MTTSFALVEGRFVPMEGGNNNKCPQSPTQSVGSTDTGYLSEDSSNCSLAEALKDTSDFYFDMSDRWRQAFVKTLDDPIYPEPEVKEEEPPVPPPGLSLRGLFSRQP
eukprot:CAMPEP_0113660324 /NCGR_PEP_ID=MMETSP0017_2-20120614/32839_1 /TAXON_ID=2856 /ORGANISM="Cylindrotheca closterium" /LENGTH=106 /DNA_ID=CAMNT_0000574951 /DNA_START=223 /DNA_END=543 /DNA_ORIENTATION=- /assembly_acc=CAM_ASM_000147